VKRRLAELEEEKKWLYAQMEIDDNEKELACQMNAVRWLSNHVQVGRGDMESSEGEEFNMDVDTSEAEDVDEETEDQIMTVSFVQHIQLGQIK
jgi:TnpA family transposase